MCILAHESDPEVKNVLDEKQYHREDVRSFHALVLAGMEAGTHSWKDYEGIQYFKQRNGYPNPPKQVHNRPRAPGRLGINLPPKESVCPAYSQSSCKERDDHNGLFHRCKWCLEDVKRTYRHGECVKPPGHNDY